MSNILIKEGVVKLNDIGEVNNIFGRKMLTLRSNRGLENKIYLAPEVINGQDNNEKSDIWAAGIIFHIMLSRGKHPFDIKGNKDEAEIVENIKKYIIKWDKDFIDSNSLKILESKNLF